jgi:dGTPase
MSIREMTEQWETERLSPLACRAAESRGRDREEEPCGTRTCFQRDRDRIVHSKAFRRLQGKTQVYIAPEGDHFRTRLTHTLEVSQVARTLARSLRLNEDLTEAIALGHDLGHTPFGHAGERALNEVCPHGFTHTVPSVRTVDILEKDGQGLNLTMEVRDGILNHQMSSHPATLEGQVVRLADKLAYIHHDVDDAIRAGILTENDLPAGITDIIGHTCNKRLDCFIHDIVTESTDRNEIGMSDMIGQAMQDLRDFMFDHVYTNPMAKSEEGKAEALVKTLYGYYLDHTEMLPKYLVELLCRGEEREQVVCDYIASMTDRFATAKYEEIFVPKTWHG